MELLKVDCGRCLARGPVCADCVMSVLLGSDSPSEFDAAEQQALAALATSGLIPPLRLVADGRATHGNSERRFA